MALTMPSVFSPAPFKVGIIGLDTSHSVAFTKIIHNNPDKVAFRDMKVTHAFPQGSKDIPSSYNRIRGYTNEMQELGATITASVEELVDQVDGILLETNDGKLHLEQARIVFRSRKPVFIDKPVAAGFEDVYRIFREAKDSGTPMFSASGLRYGPTTQAVAAGEKIGKVLGADAYSPAKLESSHTDLYWYGIHGIETLCTVMGPGCTEVERRFTLETDLVVGYWNDRRMGSFRGIRAGSGGYGASAFGDKGVLQWGAFEGYDPLVEKIATFLRSREAPIDPLHTLEIYALMTAADLSKERGGARVTLEEVMEQAKKAVDQD